MSDFFKTLVQRMDHTAPVIRPLIPPMFARGIALVQSNLDMESNQATIQQQSFDDPKAVSSTELPLINLVKNLSHENDENTSSLTPPVTSPFRATEGSIRQGIGLRGMSDVEKIQIEHENSIADKNYQTLELDHKNNEKKPTIRPMLIRQAQPEPFHPERRTLLESKTSSPTIRVHIGRVEVRAIMPSIPQKPSIRAARKSPSLSLDDYLKQRDGGKR